MQNEQKLGKENGNVDFNRWQSRKIIAARRYSPNYFLLSCCHVFLSTEILLPDGVGFELESVTTNDDGMLRQIEIQGEAESEAFSPDSDLNALIAAWPKLPAAIKAGILAMIRASE